MKTIREKILDLRKRKQNKYSIKQLIEFFGTDSHWAIIFILNLPLSIPGPPYAAGFSTLPSGIVTLLLVYQILLGYKKIYLPEFVEKKIIDISIVKTEEYLKFDKAFNWVEKRLKKRQIGVFNPLFEKILAISVIPNALLMMLPIVLTNWLPCLAITLISFIYLFKDGYFIFLAFIFAWAIVALYLIVFIFFGRFIWKKRNIWTFGALHS